MHAIKPTVVCNENLKASVNMVSISRTSSEADLRDDSVTAMAFDEVGYRSRRCLVEGITAYVASVMWSRSEPESRQTYR